MIMRTRDWQNKIFRALKDQKVNEITGLSV